MQNIIKNADGTVTVTLDQTDLNVIGAGIWAGKEEGNLYGRFFPDYDNLSSPEERQAAADEDAIDISKVRVPIVDSEPFYKRLYEISSQLSNLDVDMG